MVPDGQGADALAGRRIHRVDQRFLKGETHIVLAWVGPRPAASSTKGEPSDLPAADQRRDGSGAQLRAPEIVGNLVERG